VDNGGEMEDQLVVRVVVEVVDLLMDLLELNIQLVMELLTPEVAVVVVDIMFMVQEHCQEDLVVLE
jgi:hypothetical protein